MPAAVATAVGSRQWRIEDVRKVDLGRSSLPRFRFEWELTHVSKAYNVLLSSDENGDRHGEATVLENGRASTLDGDRELMAMIVALGDEH
ncbi:hypothetical protein EH165_08765 [Nakamurella antarctica]|uniref:Uncharacterized protein n=1 Tax=Nakamurella antarctica TaxID=1902245 RepID=A0A3G8ZN42_9ACTN|nr:hypothetical protein [Nakamurella antarctica]AZI58215.1 hypothetical protein EH165_08765 [Nakamurella antarctica]